MVTVIRAHQNGGVPTLESDDEFGDNNNGEELDVSMFNSKK
jgi:hypothetical protein